MRKYEGDRFRPCARTRALVVAYGMGAILAAWATVSPAAGPQAAATPSVFASAMQNDYKNIFEAALLTGAQAPNGQSMPVEQLLALASRDGLQRLDDRSIDDLVHLRLELAQRSDTATCAGIWSGSIARNLVPAIEKLPADQQRQWASIFNSAAQATINKTPIRPAPTPDQYQPALSRMLNGVPPDDLQAINSAIDARNLSADQECHAVRAFYGGMVHANPADRIMVARALLYK
jgi:hypothetical protein